MKTELPGGRPFDPWKSNLDDFHSADPAMIRCLELARAVARTDLPILILGESGTGKTLLARAIHNSSKRAGAPFVSFNAAALSDTLLDSQLFGHERGAFTGAQKAVKGKFELADKGTLFIDEIADMSAAAQAKILRAVEYGEFERLGSESLQKADVRLISATHLPLRELTGSNHFRKDLFYRLSGIALNIPPLRQRQSDLRSLVAAGILLASRRQGKVITGLDQVAADLVFSYHWPGNLRELDRVISVAVSLSPGPIIVREAIVLEEADRSPSAALQSSGEAANADEDLTLRTVVGRHVSRVLEKMGGNKRRAAKVLGLSRSTLDRKLLS